ncbi:serine hydrolase [Rossellomorea aquimaris]|uniref:serine hydrolase domain-containing protein n=1 Tax=Rossellomorea aquimaris TaxID=189382 RepID=UPI00215DB42D|nr:serine hydrolase domain-containing protein [Rossellomorea aquimaris]
MISIFKRAIVIVIFLNFISLSVTSATDREETINEYLLNEIDKGDIKDLSVVIVKDGKIFYRNTFNKSSEIITNNTLFEIGSNSKAFTALGVLKLYKEGKIDLNDDIKKYLPWLNVTFNGKTEKITIHDLLHHRSGIPYSSISEIPKNNKNFGLKATAWQLKDLKLNQIPGKKYEYVTFNYDLLGLIIEEVSGEKFSDFMYKEILQPLGLENTTVGYEYFGHDKAIGYKNGFFTTFRYDAPKYYGNVPAGYFNSNIIDISRWINIQLGNIKIKGFEDLIILSQENSSSINSKLNYAAGWFQLDDKKNTELFHGGNNPNYSSFILIDKKNNIGIGVLNNLNTSYSTSIAYGLKDIISPGVTESIPKDFNQRIDKILTFSILVLLIFNVFLFLKINKLIKEDRGQNIRIKIVNLKTIFIAALITIFFFLLYKLPTLLLGMSWDFLIVWLPFSLIPAVILISLLVLSTAIYFSIRLSLRNRREIT